MGQVINVHIFDDSVEAYGHCQWDDEVHTGDVLVIPSEGIVGIAHTWPVAVTVEHKELHRAGSEWSGAEAKITDQQIANAIKIAKEHGFPINSEVKVFREEA